MPMYRDSNGSRYWFDQEPPADLVRPDLILMTDEEAAQAEAEAEAAALAATGE